MPFVNDSQLAKSIRSGEISSLYYFYGKDVSTLEAYTKRLVSKLVKKEQEDLNLNILSGKNLDLSQLADICDALPMFADRVVVTINDLNAEQLNAEDMKFLTSILSNLADTTTVIIYATGIDVYNGKKALVGKNKKLCDLASKVGYACEFAFKKASELVKPITAKVEKQGCTISKKSAEYLANQCLCNMLIINNEIDKLCSYSMGKEITNDTIDLLVPKQLDTNAFALARAVTHFNGKLAMELLAQLYDQQSEGIAILGAISMAFIDLYRARVAINDGVSQADVISDFSYRGRAFAVRNAFRDCSSISVSRLRRCIKILGDTDIKLKSSRIDSKLLLETAITEMLIK